MGPPRGHLHPRAAELKRRGFARRHAGTARNLTLALAAFLPILLVAVPWPTASVAPAKASTPITPEAWARIAEDLEGVAPATVLLGGTEACVELDQTLGQARVSRESFRLAASDLAARVRVGAGQDSQALIEEVTCQLIRHVAAYGHRVSALATQPRGPAQGSSAWAGSSSWR